MCYDADADFVGLTMGTTDDESIARLPEDKRKLVPRHIYISEKAEWFQIPDDGGTREETMSGIERLLGRKS